MTRLIRASFLVLAFLYLDSNDVKAHHTCSHFCEECWDYLEIACPDYNNWYCSCTYGTCTCVA
jgi:hypothetical protein